ncbi:hypothetical protein SporoP37_07895 [Sporosarcina sp. P37]|uniref:ATP-binding protein n=1 Tax=unclassified Sporosarcina TaxID=2647733 RepID=UPI000A17C970|nr:MULTISPECIES: ATP-binding protein [unclassified Sporosarcina]ARK24592.1 hypothetical protein SporoP37_07895 [Sporosarcina sp. P37]PID19749.1 histidine kinase [Sporosarcina sp. P35]
MASKRGIRQQYIRIFIVSLVIAVIGMGGMYAYVNNSWNDLEEEQQDSLEKARLVELLSDSIQDVFFRIRGYYAFQIEEELNGAYLSIQDVHTYSRQFKSLPLNVKEKELIQEIDSFMIDYEETTLPKAIQFIKDNDYEGLRNLAQGGTNQSVNSFIHYANEYDIIAKEELLQAYERTKKQSEIYFLLITILGLAFLLIPIYTVWNVIKRVVRPVEKITSAVDQYETEGQILFQPIARDNEIGALSQSIYKMMQRIQMNEQEVLSQNEELITQQAELFNRQTKMEFALSEARFSRVRLERYNGLGHLLSFSLDKREICMKTADYLNHIFQPDLSLLLFVKGDIYSLKGISDTFFSEIKEERLNYFKERLNTEPYFVIKREADYEKGISEQITYVYDFVSGIFNAENELSVITIQSRIGKPFTEDDQKDLYSLLKRIALSVDRVDQYELIIHERQLNQSILDNINEGIRFVSNTDEEDKYNAALFELLDMEPESEDKAWPREEWTEYFLQQIDDPVQYRQFLDTTLDTESAGHTNNTYILTLQSKESRVMNVYSVPIIIQGRKVGTIFVHRDITHEHEVNKMKTELVSTVSHELRTPLSSILGFSELLLYKDMDEKRKKRYLETIHGEANRLTALINDFLDIQRMESGRQTYQMEEISVGDISIEAVNKLPIQSQLHKIILQDVTCSSSIKGDHDRILQVFLNLIGNAIKFSPDGGEINITLFNQQDSVVVSIKDQGIGIPAETIGHLFEKFYRFDNSYSRKIGGTGLGLSICKEIIQDHNGQIWVDSEENSGTTIFFSLPLIQMLPEEHIQSDKPLIAVVEDDVNIALLLGEELSSNGFSIIHHSSVDKAFTCIQQMRPAAVVVDLLLENGEDGWDLIRQMKEREETKTIPIIISSALEKEPQLMEQFDINDYFTKPYPLGNLSATVLQTLERPDGRILYPENN